MNVKELTAYLKEKVKRNIEIVPPPKKDDGGGDKKGKEGGGDKKEEKKEGGGDKKGGESKPAAGGGGGGEGSSKGVEGTKVEVNKLEYHGLNPQTHYANAYPMYNQSYYNQDYGLPDHQYQGHPPNQGYGNTGYVVQYAPGPPPPPPTYMNYNDQMFSDENPNGCSVM